MIRSKEIMRNKAVPAKAMHHLEIHPNMGGGVRVEHHHTESKAHPMEAHEFKAHEGAQMADHVMQHSGMSWEPMEENKKEANAGAANEVQNQDAVRQA